MNPKIEIAKALAVLCELTGTELSSTAMDMMVNDLLEYPLGNVMKALERCRKELKGRLTLAAIIDCIDTGLPNADEAWALVVEGLRNEAVTIVIPEIAQLAAGTARELWLGRDQTGARMAFREAYNRLQHEKQGQPIKWVVEAGTDKEQREARIREAVQLGRINHERALVYLPDTATETREMLLTGNLLSDEQKRLGQQNTGKLIALLAEKMSIPSDAA